MRQSKKNFALGGTPPADGPSNVFQGTGNPSPEEVERRQLPTQPNMFPHQTSPHTDDEALALTLGD